MQLLTSSSLENTMQKRKVENPALTLAEIISFIVLCTLFILYICMFILISCYVQHSRQKQQSEKHLNTPENGKEINQIENEKLATYVTVVEKYSMFTKEMTYNTHQSAIPTHQSTIPTQQSTVPSHQSTIPTQQSTVPTQQSTIPTHQSTFPTQQSTIPTQQSTIPTQQSVFTTQHSTISTIQSNIPTPKVIFPPTLISNMQTTISMEKKTRGISLRDSKAVLMEKRKQFTMRSVSQAMRYKYKKFQSADCPFKDIKRIHGELRACIKECDKINRCVGFMFHYNKPGGKYCWLKYKCDVIPRYSGANMYLYLKKKDNTHQAINTQAVAENRKQPDIHSNRDKDQKQTWGKWFGSILDKYDDYYYDDDYDDYDYK